MLKLTLSVPEFSILTTLVEERIGIAYSLADKAIFEGKLALRLEEAGYSSALDYYYCLRYDDPDGSEFRALAEALTVHETFFFRELQPLRVALERMLAPDVTVGQRLRVWSAACSTGEEPLSLAMLAASLGSLQEIEIVASDLSGAALARARAGQFGARAVRARLPAWAEPFLLEHEGGYRVPSELTSAIQWRVLNLLESSQLDALGEFDLVLCRNVLIYFREQTARTVVENLAARLKPGGVLLVGVSESLMRFDTSLHCEEHAGVFMYRKVAP